MCERIDPSRLSTHKYRQATQVRSGSHQCQRISRRIGKSDANDYQILWLARPSPPYIDRVNLEQMVSLAKSVRGVKPPASSLNALHTMQANRATSNVERSLRKALWAAGARGFRVRSKLPGHPDIVFPKLRRAIFVHGCFWHRCGRCSLSLPKANREFWANKFAETQARDRRVIAELEAIGWQVCVVWECDVKRDLPVTAKSLIDCVSVRAPLADGVC